MVGKRKSAVISSRRRLRLDTWLLRHLQVALASLGRLVRAPLSSLMTSAVIGIALALPSGLHLLLDNTQTLSGSWEGAATISIYLKQESSREQVESLAARLRRQQGIAEVRLISRDQALTEFRRLSGFGEVLDTLGENPLPDVLVIEPDAAHSSPRTAGELLNRLRKADEVDFAQLDMQWVRRFHALTEIAGRAVLVLATLLGLAVLLVVVNTIRLEIQNRHTEIEITKLIGATDAFIRRPFLYSGIWYGLLGGIIAWLLVSLSLWLLDAPVARLAELYGSGFELAGLGFTRSMLLLGGSTLLGLGGSWIAVGRHLNRIEPS